MKDALFMGRTAEGERVYVEIDIREPENKREIQYTDHTFAAPPREVAMSWVIIEKGAPNLPLSEIPDGWWRSAGQVPVQERVIVRDEHPDYAYIQEAWDKWHLNTMNAACDHMTPEMLARREGENTHDWQTRMLNECKCPVGGYRWGHAWLAKRVPDEVIERLTEIARSAS